MQEMMHQQILQHHYMMGYQGSPQVSRTVLESTLQDAITS
jgi:hypothetical protein